jgi:hypothetical protein
VSDELVVLFLGDVDQSSELALQVAPIAGVVEIAKRVARELQCEPRIAAESDEGGVVRIAEAVVIGDEIGVHAQAGAMGLHDVCLEPSLSSVQRLAPRLA